MDHKCYMLKKNIKPHSKKYVFFDFETKLKSKSNKHVVNYCIAQDSDGKENVFHNVGKFGVGLLNDAGQILPRPTPVAMATKFGTKLAIIRSTQEISPRSVRITGGFRGRAIEGCRKNSTTTDPHCYGNEI